MNSYRRTAIIVGALFLIAMVTSLVGGIWLESMITARDYLSTVSANQSQVIIGVQQRAVAFDELLSDLTDVLQRIVQLNVDDF